MTAITLRPATLDDLELLRRWDEDPDVIASTTDDPEGLDRDDWADELAMQSDVSEYLIAEADGRPIGALQIVDPHTEPTHYWGEIEPDLRALDIWIGEPADRGRGLGEAVMRAALARCFAPPQVKAVVIDPLASNTRAHAFYQRLGFAVVGRQLFSDGEDDCLVHRLTRATWTARFPDDAC